MSRSFGPRNLDRGTRYERSLHLWPLTGSTGVTKVVSPRWLTASESDFNKEGAGLNSPATASIPKQEKVPAAGGKGTEQSIISRVNPANWRPKMPLFCYKSSYSTTYFLPTTGSLANFLSTKKCPLVRRYGSEGEASGWRARGPFS